jgi:hypothetical protein
VVRGNGYRGRYSLSGYATGARFLDFARNDTKKTARSYKTPVPRFPFYLPLTTDNFAHLLLWPVEGLKLFADLVGQLFRAARPDQQSRKLAEIIDYFNGLFQVKFVHRQQV